MYIVILLLVINNIYNVKPVFKSHVHINIINMSNSRGWRYPHTQY